MDKLNFKRELLALGRNDKERSLALGVSRRTLIEYKASKIPFHIEKLMRQPLLLRALADDADALNAPVVDTAVVSE